MSEIVDWNDLGRNMYGCAPCPQCGSTFRAAYQREHGLTIECDDCGHKSPARYAEDEAGP